MQFEIILSMCRLRVFENISFLNKFLWADFALKGLDITNTVCTKQMTLDALSPLKAFAAKFTWKHSDVIRNSLMATNLMNSFHMSLHVTFKNELSAAKFALVLGIGTFSSSFAWRRRRVGERGHLHV